MDGLYVRVYPSGVRAWSYRYTFLGQRERMSLGESSKLSLEEARDLATTLNADIIRGIDPKVSLSRVRSSGLTVSKLCQQAIDEIDMRPKTRADWAGHLKRNVDPYIGTIPATALSRDHIRKWGQTVAAKSGGYSANRAFELVRRAMSYAIENDRIISTPFTGLKPPFSGEKQRERVLSSSELACIMVALREPDSRPLAVKRLEKHNVALSTTAIQEAIELMLLCLTRKTATLGARASEFDLEAKLWTVPASREKSGRTHVVPLSTAALDLLARVRERGGRRGYLFPPGGGVRKASSDTPHVLLGSHQMDAIRARVDQLAKKKVEPWSVHTFRHTGATWLVENGFADVVGGILSHVDVDISATTRIYAHASRMPRRREALEAWGTHLLKLLSAGQPRANGDEKVNPMGAKALSPSDPCKEPESLHLTAHPGTH